MANWYEEMEQEEREADIREYEEYLDSQRTPDEREKLIQLRLLATIRDEFLQDGRARVEILDQIIEELGFNLDEVREYQK